MGAAFLLFTYVAIYIYYLWHSHTYSRFAMTYCLGIASIAALLFSLGRWLGSREASEEVG